MFILIGFYFKVEYYGRVGANCYFCVNILSYV